MVIICCLLGLATVTEPQLVVDDLNTVWNVVLATPLFVDVDDDVLCVEVAETWRQSVNNGLLLRH